MGRIGRPHGLDGSFHLEDASVELTPGARVRISGRETTVERVFGVPQRPLIGLAGVEDRSAAERLRGEEVQVERAGGTLDEGEYYSSDLVGCSVPGIGSVRRVIPAPSCDILEVGDDVVLVPLVADAVKRIDPSAGIIEVDLRFLGLAP